MWYDWHVNNQYLVTDDKSYKQEELSTNNM